METCVLLTLCKPTETNSKPNRILCSEAAAKLLTKQDPRLRLRSRGIIPIKGKGDMRVYWVNETKSRDDIEEQPQDCPVSPAAREPVMEASEIEGAYPDDIESGFVEGARCAV